MTRLRVAVIGAGTIAQEHLKVLTQHPACTVAVLSDVNPASLQATGDRFGIPERVGEPETLLSRDDLDAVFVLVSVLHVAPVAAKFIAAGLPTFLEKPPGIYSSDTRRLAELQQRHGTIGVVGLNRRFYSTHLELRQRLATWGPLATLTVDAHEDLARASRQKFSPLVLQRWAYGNGIHALDLLRYFGGEVAMVHASHRTVENPFPDSYSATLQFADGAHGRAAIDWFAPSQHRFELRSVGALATSAVGFGPTTLRVRGQPDETLELDEDDRRYKPGFWKQATAFLEGVRAGKQPPFPAPTLADAHLTMALIDQICQLPPGPKEA